jgi:hypothetical protein
VKPRRLLVLSLLLPLVAGCGYDEGADLRPAVERITPPGGVALEACGGSSGLIDYPSHSCTYLVRSTTAAATQSLASTLRREGFVVSCRQPGELAALRGDVRVTAEVTEHGSISTAGGVVNVLRGGYRAEGARRIPSGSVVVRVGAIRQSESSAAFWRRQVEEGGRCDQSPAPINPLEHCVNWWNGPVGRTTSESVRRRRIGGPVQIVAAERPGVSSCTYMIRARDGFAEVGAKFDHGDWAWQQPRRVRRPARFRPNATLYAHGWLALRD